MPLASTAQHNQLALSVMLKNGGGMDYTEYDLLLELNAELG